MTPDIVTLIRARTTLLWISTPEELRVERVLIETAAKAGFETILWDCDSGVTTAQGKPYGVSTGNGNPGKDPEQALENCRTDTKKAVWIFRDLDPWLASPTTARKVKSMARDLQGAPSGQERIMVVLTKETRIPLSLQGSATAIDWPLPDREAVGKILDATLEASIGSLRKRGDEKSTARADALDKMRQNGAREAAIDAAVGLTTEEIAGCYARSLVRDGTIDVTKVRQDKATVIAREKVLEWYEPDPMGLEGIGGLETAKEWLVEHRAAFSKEARDYGLPAPKGVLLVGPPGTGKSLLAKCIANAWGMPLLRLDLGGLKSKYVGESEQNIRAAIRVAESVAPCILWIDEIEKALAGATGPQGDGGVGSDAMGTLLTFMQERKGSVFFVATANDVSSLPPELLRKGRFDEIFFVDLPTHKERIEILGASIKRVNRDPATFDLDAIAGVTNTFTGAEIAAMIPEAMFKAFAQKREPNTDDLLVAAANVTPLAKTAAEKIENLQKWADGRARRASPKEERTYATPSIGRVVDFE